MDNILRIQHVMSHQGDDVLLPVSRGLGSMTAVAAREGTAAESGELVQGTRAATSSATLSRETDTAGGALVSATLPIRCARDGFAQARAFTRETLCRWSLDHYGDDAAIVAMELVTNAAHAVRLGTAQGGNIWLELGLCPAHLVLAVYDTSDDAPAPKPCPESVLAEHGRGLYIVDSLVDEWGWTPRPPAGKKVWAKWAA
ncbi:ATP-binding protein [Streptomyces spiralis]